MTQAQSEFELPADGAIPSTERQLIYLKLARIPTIGPVLIKRLLDTFGSPEGALGASADRIATLQDFGTKRAEAFLRGAATVDPRAEYDQLVAANVTLLCPEDPRYPLGLKWIHDPPIVLFTRGNLQRDDLLSIGIVGSRECTLYGRQQAERFGAELAESNLVVISGGARGIDTGAHEGALRVGGRTIVVQGCGLANTYPPENARLYERIVNDGSGAIVSELPLHEPPVASNFPPRNRIIAGMSLGVLVIEANLRSGSLITARLAADDYGREVFALPGRVDSAASAGTHHLIKTAAARLIENVGDIVEALGDVGRFLNTGEKPSRAGNPIHIPARPARSSVPKAAQASAKATAPSGLPFTPQTSNPSTPAMPTVPLTPAQRSIIDTLQSGKHSADDLCDHTRLPASVVIAELTLLQIRGKVQRLGQHYILTKTAERP
jgi:DNA processing protein